MELTREFIQEVQKTAPGKEASPLLELLQKAVADQEQPSIEPQPTDRAKQGKPGRPRKEDSSRPTRCSDMHKRKDQLASFADPDARFGHKSRRKKFLGYKAHISMDESGIVTSLQTFPGNDNESTKLKGLLKEDKEDKEKKICHESVTADGLYDSAGARGAIEAEGMKAFIPSRFDQRQIDGGFEYDPKEDLVICSDGKTSIGKIRQDNGDLYYFSRRDCACCTKADCLKKNNRRVRVYVSDVYKLNVGTDPEAKREALIVRKAVERKFGEAKKWHGLRRARYRGR